MITESGRKLWANAIGDLSNGYAGTIKETKETVKLVPTGTEEELKWVENAFVGQDVYSESLVGTIVSNTPTELVVARWEKLPVAGHAYTRAEEASEPPKGSAAFSIASGACPAAWVGISADTAEPKASNTTLKGEIGTGKVKSSKFGLVRSFAAFKYLAPKEYEVKVTFTAGTEDTVPVALAKIGVFNAQNGGIMMFESLLTATAEIKESGDAVTVTDVVQGS